ncbi:MAG TPA: DNA repair protein RecN, partial [Actinomycetota bacterium]|nr:DNA repair protein RecN [Actinomycetota bacterium]
ELHITGLSVIEDLDLELNPGLNVLTGETGAGKTMVTVGLALALGQRASASLVRSGLAATRVEARFDATAAATQAGWAEDGEVVLARRVAADGRSTARVGGQLAPVSALAELGAGLVEVHGQHQGLRLLSGAAQTAFLDRFIGAEHLATLESLAAETASLRRIRTRLEHLDEETRERERELDLLAYQIREIESVGPRQGERSALEVEQLRLAHAERLLELVAGAEAGITGEGTGGDALASGAAALGIAAELDPGAAELARRAEALANEATELGRDLRSYAEAVQLDPARLEDIRSRIASLRDLERKYGEGEAEVLAFLERARDRAEELGGTGQEREHLVAEAERADVVVAELADRVSTGRQGSVGRLAEAIAGELQELGMEGGQVRIDLLPLPEVAATGAERAEFRFSGGPGQPLLPLAKVASGGELSRTMLACRTVLGDLDDVPTLVFDEVDQGIGGRAGVAVGRRLARLAARRQVVVVTHLPQIAAFADRHIRVRKRSGVASVEVLDDAGRVAELSRMLSGLPATDAAATHAEELLSEAAKARTAHGSRRPARAG